MTNWITHCQHESFAHFYCQKENNNHIWVFILVCSSLSLYTWHEKKRSSSTSRDIFTSLYKLNTFLYCQSITSLHLLRPNKNTRKKNELPIRRFRS